MYQLRAALMLYVPNQVVNQNASLGAAAQLMGSPRVLPKLRIWPGILMANSSVKQSQSCENVRLL